MSISCGGNHIRVVGAGREEIAGRSLTPLRPRAERPPGHAGGSRQSRLRPRVGASGGRGAAGDDARRPWHSDSSDRAARCRRSPDSRHRRSLGHGPRTGKDADGCGSGSRLARAQSQSGQRRSAWLGRLRGMDPQRPYAWRTMQAAVPAAADPARPKSAIHGRRASAGGVAGRCTSVAALAT